MSVVSADLALATLARRACRDGTVSALRKEAGLSIRQLAPALGVHPSTLLRWEAATIVPSGRHAVLLGQALAELGALVR